MKKILITGSAGFIGFHLARKLLKEKYYVIGIDNLVKTYNPKIKILRIKELKKYNNFKFIKLDINDLNKKNKIQEIKFECIFHLAAQAGVRQSLDFPQKFFKDNINGTLEVFEYAKKKNIKRIYYASSSSVYGKSNVYPSNETININKPISIYGLTKTTNELIAYYYQNTFRISSIGFRFFTVYGTYGRPDMSIPIFITSILKNKTIKLLNYGNNYRDYTYVEDVIKNIWICFKKTQKNKLFYNVYNIGGEHTIKLKELVKLISKIIKKKTRIKLVQANNLDVKTSLADNSKIKKFTKNSKITNLETGIKETYHWIKKNLKYF